MAEELFELDLLGGAVERAYRRARPEVDALPWGSLRIHDVPAPDLLNARREWTATALQEYASAANAALTLRTVLRARAPLDLTAMLSQVPLDELTHSELCARVASELGGGTPLRYERGSVFALPGEHDETDDPTADAAVRVVREFCVGESLSLALLRAVGRASKPLLLREVFEQLAGDETRHAAFGWIFVDWALPRLDRAGRARLGRAADDALAGACRLLAAIEESRQMRSTARLGWVGSLGAARYAATGRRWRPAPEVDTSVASNWVSESGRRALG